MVDSPSSQELTIESELSGNSSTPGLAWRTLKNSLWSMLEFGWPILVSLVATPFIVRSLGADAYGVLSIVAVTIGFLGMLDLGIGGAALRAIAQASERGDSDRIGRVLGTVTLFYIVVGLAGAAFLVASTPWLISSVLDVPLSLRAEAETAFYVASFGFLVSLVLGAFSAVPKALQRFDITTKMSIVLGTFSTALVVCALLLGLGLRGVIAAQVAMNVTAGVAYYFAARRLVPGLHVAPSLDRALLRELIAFGGYFLVANLGVQLLYQVDKLLVGGLVSVAAVTFYVVPGNITQKLQQLMGAAAQVIFPVSSALAAKDDRETIGRLYSDATRLIFLLGASISVALIVFARPFLQYWMGGDFAAQSSTVMVLLGLTYLLLGLTGPAWGTALGVGSARTNAIFATGMGVVDVALFLVLTPRFGIIGSAVAYLIVAAVGMPALAWYVERRLVGLSGFRFLKQYIRPLGAAVPAAAAALALRNLAVGVLPTLALMALTFALTPALYFGLRLAEPRDRQMAAMILARIRGA
ncbi:MAG: oligosaccharide flippase family protein [Coriobacteriia bacterium]